MFQPSNTRPDVHCHITDLRNNQILIEVYFISIHYSEIDFDCYRTLRLKLQCQLFVANFISSKECT